MVTSVFSMVLTTDAVSTDDAICVDASDNCVEVVFRTVVGDTVDASCGNPHITLKFPPPPPKIKHYNITKYDPGPSAMKAI